MLVRGLEFRGGFLKRVVGVGVCVKVDKMFVEM